MNDSGAIREDTCLAKKRSLPKMKRLIASFAALGLLAGPAVAATTTTSTASTAPVKKASKHQKKNAKLAQKNAKLAAKPAAAPKSN